jgi:hypothetical protein
MQPTRTTISAIASAIRLESVLVYGLVVMMLLGLFAPLVSSSVELRPTSITFVEEELEGEDWEHESLYFGFGLVASYVEFCPPPWAGGVYGSRLFNPSLSFRLQHPSRGPPSGSLS